MNFTLILVIVSTCISGGLQENSIANLIDYVYENADQILEDAVEELDFDSFASLSSSDQEIAIKEAILEFNKDYYLIDDDVALVLSNSIDEDKISNYDDLDNLGNNNGSSSGGFINTDLGQSNDNYTDYISRFDNLFGDEDLGYLYEDPSRIEGTTGYIRIDPEVELLPIYDIGDVSMALNVNGKTDEYIFVGIGAPKETCIAFYNIIAGYLNDSVMETASGLSDVSSQIIELIQTFVPTLSITSFASLIAVLLKTIINTIVGLFAGGPGGIILGLAFILVVVGIIAFIGYMIYCGYKQKGFRIGREVYSILDWRRVCEQTDY